MSGMNTRQNPETRDAKFGPYLRSQKSLIAAHARAAELSAKIAAAEKEASRALEGVPTEDEVRQQGEDFAAAVALGAVTPAEAEKRRREIERLEASIAKALAASRAAAQARAGLQRMLANTHKESEELEDQARGQLAQALRAEANEIGAEYILAGAALQSSYMRLRALDELLQEVMPGAGSLRKGSWGRLFLPAINVPGCPESSDNMGVMFSEENTARAGGFQTARELERQRLREAGVEI